MNVFDKSPLVDKDVFVAPSASVIGDVQIGKGSSIWYGCVLRGEALLLLESLNGLWFDRSTKFCSSILCKVVIV